MQKIKIGSKKIILEVIIKGKRKLSEFREKYGKLFAISGPKNFRVPKDISEESDGFHVTVVLTSDEEEKFKDFLVSLS